MSSELRVGILVFAILLLLFLVSLLRKHKMPVKYAIVWVGSAFVIIALAVFPRFFGMLSDILGFDVMSNMIIALFIALLLMITMVLTVIVSRQSTKISLLIQEVSILKNKK